MVLTDFELARIDKVFERFCANRDEPRFEYRVLENDVLLFLARPHPVFRSQDMLHQVARFKKNAAGDWCLYCADGGGHWYRYQPEVVDRDIEKLLKVVADNPQRVFW